MLKHVCLHHSCETGYDMYLHSPLAMIQYCGEPPWPRGDVLDLRPPGFEFRVLCLEDSVISFISSSSGGCPGPVLPICAQRWHKTPFISCSLSKDIRKYGRKYGWPTSSYVILLYVLTSWSMLLTQSRAGNTSKSMIIKFKAGTYFLIENNGRLKLKTCGTPVFIDSIISSDMMSSNAT